MLTPFSHKGEKLLSAYAKFLLYQTSDAAALGADNRIRVLVAGQPYGDLFPGDRIRLPKHVSEWQVVPYSNAITWTVIVGDGELETSQLGGVISVVDGELDKVRQGKRFWSTTTRTQIAALFSTAGVFVNSGNAAIRAITIHCKAAQKVGLYVTSSKPLANAAANGIRNKRLSQVGSVNTEVAIGTCATYPPTMPTDFTTFYALGPIPFATNDSKTLNFNTSGPCWLEAGYGLFAVSDTANVELAVEVDLEEF